MSKLHSSLHQPVLRKLQETNCSLAPQNFMFPLFLVDNEDLVEPIESMPGQFRRGINPLLSYLKPLVDKGLSSILLFGVVGAERKDERGSAADSEDNPVVKALPKLREAFPELLIACDVCLCPYTDHGHCGIFAQASHFDNEASVVRLAEISVSYARAGAHIVAPSDMMDNRIGAIKQALVAEKLESRCSLLSYSAKFASSFYGPFRDAAQSAPSFGDRRCYQLPCGGRGVALRAVARDVAEGADMLMVKPGLPYLDIVHEAKQAFPHHPMFVYHVSGEYCMLYYAAMHKSLELEATLVEVMKSFRRAGADCIITYYTPTLLDILARGGT